jgi:hypothetical protein
MLGRWRERLPALPLFFGCVLPDLIDKPLFYGLLAVRGHVEGLITGTRTFGHTGLFLLALSAAAALVRPRGAEKKSFFSAPLAAVAVGVATHLLLDIGGELFGGAQPDTSIWPAIFFPALGVRFPVAHFGSLLEHLQITAQSAYVLAGEAIGGAILLRAWLLRKRQSW